MGRFVSIPRRKAVAIASYEYLSLEARASTSQRCAAQWARAATQARAVVEGLQAGDDELAIDAALRVGPAWKRAADCEGWPTPTQLGNAGERTAARGEVNFGLVDRYTLAHFAIGVLYGAARLPWWGALALAVGWEIVERPLKRVVRLPHGTQDTVANSVVDVLAVAGGWAAVKVVQR